MTRIYLAELGMGWRRSGRGTPHSGGSDSV